MFKFPKNIEDITNENGELIGRKYNDTGICEYYENGELYKKTYKNGKEEYYKGGKLHNKLGPAVLYKKTQEWYEHGIKIREETNISTKFYDKKGDYIYEIEKSDKDVKKTKLNDKLHSFNDEPAVVKDGIAKYYKNGKLHRDNEPAVINGDHKEYYKNGKLHNDKGPAVITKIGDQFLLQWYHTGKIIDQKDVYDFCNGKNISLKYEEWSENDKNTFKKHFDFKTYAKK